jgi:hypothetical protein
MLTTPANRKHRKATRASVWLLTITSLTGCYIWPFGGRDTPKELVEDARSSYKTTVPVQGQSRSRRPQESSNSAIEILWQVPTTPVDGFILSWGYDQSSAVNRVSVKRSDLEQISDSSMGEVYRYVLRNMPADRGIRVTVAAYKGNLTSEPSEIVSVAPDNR